MMCNPLRDALRRKLIFLVSFVLVLSLVSSNAVLGAIVIEVGIDNTNNAVEEESDGNMYMDSSDLELVDDGNVQAIGLRFLNVEIPLGANISEAYIVFTVDETEADEPVNLIIQGELASDAPPFQATSGNVRNRTTTNAVVEWSPEHYPTVGEKVQTVDISPVIQEIINQAGWNPGNALVIIINDNPNNPSVGHRTVESGSGALAALLHIELSTPFASIPSPADGTILEDTWVNLMWSPGMSAVSHDVYLGDNLADVEAGAESAFQSNQASATFIAGFPGMPYPDGLVPGTTYYWRIDGVEADGTTKYTGAVWSFMIPSKTAYNPSPADGSKHIDPDVRLSWTMGFSSKLHTVYFGDNFDDVNNAAGGLAQAVATYTPGTLEMDKTYYWRVDEFDPPATHKGDVWSFKTLPVITITDPNLIGWWTFDEGSGSTAIDFSGYGNDGKFGGDPEWIEGAIGGALDLDGDDYVTIDGVFDDITSTNITLSAWIKTTQGGEGNVFAANSGGSHPLMFGVAGGNPYVNDGGDTEFPPAVNDNQWHMITYVRNGSRGTIYVDGVEVGTYLAAFTLDGVDRWSIGQEWDTGPSDFYVGMVDDVRFYNASLTADQVKELMRGDPLVAWNPNPNNNSTVDIKEARKPLSWSAGDEAAEHDVYFGTDKDAVSNADASDTTGIYQSRQGTNSYTLPAGSIEWGGGPYYWRVDENNNDGSISAGATWSFSVADYLIVDDFESYNDLNPDDPESKRIFYTWLDGFDNPALNGSIVGYASPPFAEQNIVHSGRQAIPFFYDNGVGNSEATLTLTDQRNWTEEGVGVLTIWFRGTPGGLVEYPAGTFTISGAGTDIWGTADEFRYAYKQLSGDGEMTARVTDVGTGSNAWAKAGVMIRETLDPGSKHAMTVVTAGNGGGAAFQWRPNTGDSSSSQHDLSPAVSPPHWIRIVRQGDTFTGYVSPDGVTWTEQGSTTVSMSQNVYIGLCITSHAAGEVRSATFDNVQTTGSVGLMWNQEAIGATMATNDPDAMYVALNGGTKVYHDNPNAALMPGWTEWNIDLQAFGVNLTNVNTITLGLDNSNNPLAGGSGLIYFDDIRLYQPAP